MNEWLYEINTDNTIRYMLGTIGNKPLVCFGINPSTAEPNKLDATLRKVQAIATFNGFDSWVTFNVYPKRDTVFSNLHETINGELHDENLAVIKKYLDSHPFSSIWAAWGNHISERDYLIPCLKDIYSMMKEYSISWLSSELNLTGAPKHPLYQKNETRLEKFDMDSYISKI